MGIHKGTKKVKVGEKEVNYGRMMTPELIRTLELGALLLNGDMFEVVKNSGSHRDKQIGKMKKKEEENQMDIKQDQKIL